MTSTLRFWAAGPEGRPSPDLGPREFTAEEARAIAAAAGSLPQRWWMDAFVGPLHIPKMTRHLAAAGHPFAKNVDLAGCMDAT